MTTHVEPFFHSFTAPEEQHERTSEYKRHVNIAAREACEREIAMARAMNPLPVPRFKPPPLRQPVLPADFESEATTFYQTIYDRDVAVDRERLITLGKQRFEQLLNVDRSARELQRVLINDYTSWPSVLFGFAAVSPLAANVPRRKTAEVAAGRGQDREEASRIDSFDDLWKATQHPPTIRNILTFHDAFGRLIFGQALLDKVESDGRVRSRMFCGRHTDKGKLFHQWLSVLEGPHFRVTIDRPLWSILAWLCGERTPLPTSIDMARHLFGVRAPTAQQQRVCEAVVESFLLDYREWELWQRVGRATRQIIDVRELESWRLELQRTYPAIAKFHEVLRDYFWRSVSSGQPFDNYRQFDSASYHAFGRRETRKFFNTVSLLAAMAGDETMPDAIVGRFDDWLLVQGAKPKSIERIEQKLSAAFPGARFNIHVEELT